MLERNPERGKRKKMKKIRVKGHMMKVKGRKAKVHVGGYLRRK